MIDHFRAHWFDGQAPAGALPSTETLADRSARELLANPGRAEGKVAHWSLCRMAAVLRRAARRPLDIAPVGSETVTANERSLLAIIRALSEGDETLASHHAEWLVGKSALRNLLSTIAPLADIYPKLARAA